MDLSEVARRVEEAAREAGTILLEHFERIDRFDLKGLGDPVTVADRASEKYLRDALAKSYPDILFYGEEYGFDGAASSTAGDLCWIVDPLDGTANYACGAPIFAVSIALLQGGAPVVGVIHDPIRDIAYSAVVGGGCRRNGDVCRVSDQDPFDHMAPVGISADVIRVRPKFMERIAKGRSLGSAALQLVYVAQGAYAAAMDPYTRLWDVAAGALLVEEAGGAATHWNGEPLFPIASDHQAFRGVPFDYIASNGRRHADLAELTGAIDFPSADPRNG